MQQISGINLITYVSLIMPMQDVVTILTKIQYATVIFEDSVGMDHNTALLLAGFNGVAYFFSSMIPIWVIDRYEREIISDGSFANTTQSRPSQADDVSCARSGCLHGYSGGNRLGWWTRGGFGCYHHAVLVQFLLCSWPSRYSMALYVLLTQPYFPWLMGL